MPYILPHEDRSASVVDWGHWPPGHPMPSTGAHHRRLSQRLSPRSSVDTAELIRELETDEIRIEDPQRPSVDVGRFAAATKGKATSGRSDVRVDANGSQHNKGPIENTTTKTDVQDDRLQIPHTTLGAYTQMASNSPSKSRTTLTCTLALARAAHKTVLAEEQVARSRLEEAELLVQMLRAELDDAKLKVTQSESHVASVCDMLKEAGIPDSTTSELGNTNVGNRNDRSTGRLPRDSGPRFPPETTTRSSGRPVFPVYTSTVQLSRSSPSSTPVPSFTPVPERSDIHAGHPIVDVVPTSYSNSGPHFSRSSASFAPPTIISPASERSNARHEPLRPAPGVAQYRPPSRSHSRSRSRSRSRSPLFHAPGYPTGFSI